MKRYTGPETINFICVTCSNPILDLTRYQYTNVFIHTLNAYCGKCRKLVAMTTGLHMIPYKQKSHKNSTRKKSR